MATGEKGLILPLRSHQHLAWRWDILVSRAQFYDGIFAEGNQRAITLSNHNSTSAILAASGQALHCCKLSFWRFGRGFSEHSDQHAWPNCRPL